jgi:hypothetical protein
LPHRFAQKYVRFNLNSGLFYIKSNPRTIELMQRLETRLSREKYWDQTAYNEEMFFLSHDEYKSPQVGGAAGSGVGRYWGCLLGVLGCCCGC